VQSFPLLLDYKGKIRVKNSEKRSHRTVIATDRNGNILVFSTTGRFFTLFGMAEFLKGSKFDIDSALNLDGGTESQVFIKTKDFEFYSPPPGRIPSAISSISRSSGCLPWWGVSAPGLTLMASYLILGPGNSAAWHLIA